VLSVTLFNTANTNTEHVCLGSYEFCI
jgi:hypothetical protein